MTLLISGVVLWSLAHLFKRLAPGLRARMGTGAKGLVAVLSVLAIWMMAVGYGQADSTLFWGTGPALRGVNNLLMLGAVALMIVGHSRSRLRARLRHPMLLGVVVWAAAHVLVNGDLRSFVLFGGLGLWAAVSMVAINRAGDETAPWQGGTPAGDIRLAVMSLLAYAAIGAIHGWVGVSPFTGM